ncbi:hypothetical protein DI272_01535 [Streptomyces sp. Act143]|nr:hypothetical protein DI272_01535 [Streptomyces sp. Act143]
MYLLPMLYDLQGRIQELGLPQGAQEDLGQTIDALLAHLKQTPVDMAAVSAGLERIRQTLTAVPPGSASSLDALRSAPAQETAW